MNIKAFVFCILFVTFAIADTKLQKVSLQLLWKHQFEFAGFYIAKEKGFYKEVGLDVELKEAKYGLDITKSVTSGESTYGINYPNIILEKSHGAKIHLLSAIFQSSPHVFITLESSNINSISDFQNKKIMLDSNTVSTVPLLSLLYSKNVNPKSLEMTPPSFNINDLVDGKVDIYSAFISNEVFKLTQNDIKFKVWDPKDYGFDFYNDILFTSSKELEENPTRVEQFTQASLKGWEYAFHNIEETVDIILKKYNTQNKTREALIYEAKELKKLAYFKTDEIGTISKNKIQRILDIYNLMGLTKDTVDLNEFIFDTNKHKIHLTQDEQEYIKNNPSIKIASELYSPPFNFQRARKAQGFSIDYIKLLAQKTGLDTTFISIENSSEIEKKLHTKEIDVVLNVFKTKAREDILNFTSPYLKAQKAIFSYDKSIQSLQDLKGKKVAVVNSFFIHRFLKEHYPDIILVTKESFHDVIEELIEDKVDAVVEEYSIIEYILQENGYSVQFVHMINDPRISQNLHITTRKELHILKDILQKAMDNVTEEELNTIKHKWLKSDNNSLIKKIDFSDIEKLYLQKKEAITMCIDPAWMPFEKFENGKHIGISADYFKIFKYNLNKNIKIIPTKNWSESLDFAKKRKCDILSLAMSTPERDTYMNFTTPYLKIPLVIATKPEVTFINDFRALENKKVGITKGYAFIEILKEKYPYINIVEVENLKDGLEKVKKEELFGYIGTLASVGYMFQTEFTGELKVAGKFEESWQLGIGVRNDDAILLDIMQKLVDSIETSQSQTILNKWLAVKYEQKVDYKFLWQILGIVAIVLFLFIYRQYFLFKSNQRLKELVAEKTKELRELNKSLEAKVEDSIMQIRQKDKILHEQSKMAAMGEMIGNISHQWRQPLSIISTAASGMKMKIEFDMFDKNEEVKSLDAITDATQYLSDTIDDFRNFLKPDQEKRSFNVKNIIDKTFSMFGNSFQSCNIKFVLDINECEITGNENELLQVLINILNNSKDAFKENDSIKERYIFISVNKLKEHLIITIKDSAGGIKEKNIENVFEPYFTTKHQSIGTGIGLYMSYQIVHNKFGGRIIATNTKYEHNNTSLEGAQFEIILPLIVNA